MGLDLSLHTAGEVEPGAFFSVEVKGLELKLWQLPQHCAMRDFPLDLNLLGHSQKSQISSLGVWKFCFLQFVAFRRILGWWL